MIADGELLRRYAKDGSEDSFSELVRLRAGFVYGAALRRTRGNSHLANDITQQVFIALARNARRLASHPVLSGWLYLTTRNISVQMARAERRRQNREKESTLMQENDAAAGANSVDVQFRDNLDWALEELNERDRQAVWLRFFEECSFAEIASRSQLTENAARMRVERALEKLRGAFARRGVTSTAAMLTTGLTAQAKVAVPAATDAAFAHPAMVSAGVSAGAWGITFMSMTKMQAGLVVLVIALGAGGVVFHQHTTARLQREIDRLSGRQNEEIVELKKENLLLKQAAAPAPAGNTRPESPAPLSATAASAPPATRSLAASSEVSLAAGLIPVKTLDHSSRTTPRGAFSTQIWAAAQGDIELEQSSIRLSPEAQEKLRAVLATLPESVRDNYGTPEKLMASVLAGSPHPVGGIQILDEKPSSETTVWLDTQWQHADDTLVHHSSVELQRDDTGNWQMVVPMVLVDRAIAYLTRKSR